ncbi:MTRF1L release factor glutamine methyltransferase [Chironomus tepperi]|uniref:MTRF1L release factor glutamine methyltransferase n=1 Tax=Chironomus tepperi TaxID=113505 RepID=UPI00391F9466
MLKSVFNLKNFQKSLSLTNLPLNQRFSIKAIDIFHNKLEQLKKENVTEPENSLELIFAHVLNKKLLREVRGSSLEKLTLTDEQTQKIDDCVLCRLSRMPTQYILKNWEFRDLELNMKIPVFIPRPETEELIELVTQKIDPQPGDDCRVLEVGCGTGAISLSLLNELPNLKTIIAIDQSKTACELTLENAKKLDLADRIRIFKHKVDSDTLPDEITLNGQFDCIISNPPYVPKKDLLKLDPEIYLYEDLRALDGGEDGLDIINILLKLAAKYLKKGGSLWLEVDHRHPEIIEKIVEMNQDDWKLKYAACYKDIFKKDRFVEIEKV